MQLRSLLRNFFCLVWVFNFQVAKATEVLKGNKTIGLPTVWKFKIDPNNVGETQKWYSTSVTTAGWDSARVPGNWDLQNEYSKYKGKAWYKTSFVAPAISGKQLVLSFGEVGSSYKVYLNGQAVADIFCGNYEEQIDVTKWIKQGAHNQLTVLVDNSLYWGAYWNWGGIRRKVNLLVREPVYIERQAIVSTPDLSNGTAAVTTTIYIANKTAQTKTVQVQQIVELNAALRKASTIKTVSVPANGSIACVLHMALSAKEVKLWHFDHPHLYKSTIQLSTHQLIDYAIANRFGIRKIELDGYRFLLNGESVRLAGYNWVADDRTTGSMLPEWRYKEDIDLMKIAGANMARLSHRPLPEDVMDYLDEKGILVLSEFNNWPQFMNAKSVEPQHFATKLIQQSFNHPCVFGWSVGNENGNLKENPEVNDYVASIIRYIKQHLDSTRLVTYVSNTADFQDNDAAQYCDVIMINKYGNYEKGVDELKKRYPNKAVFMSEYGSHTDNLIYDTPDKTLFKSMMVDNLRARENLFGYSLWTFNDYRSTYQAPNPATTTPIHQNRQWGIVDVYRNKKRAFTQMQQFYAPIKQLAATWLKEPSGTIVSSITPRDLQDIPAYTLRGYQLIWELRDVQNKAQQFKSVPLADFKPGSKSFNDTFFWHPKATDALVKVSLLSPTGYSVIDTIIHLIKPLQPTIKQIITAGTDSRIFFHQHITSKEYIVYYENDGIVKHSKSTIHPFADINGLSLDKVYNIWVTAINAAGESNPSEKMQIVPKAGYQNLPPIVWLSEPTNQGFFVGYSYHYSDQQYDVRYGLASQPESMWKEISTTNFGCLKVDGLENGKQYAYQIRRRPAFTAAPSFWSERLALTPNQGHFYGTPILHGFEQKKQQLILSITPAQHASGYLVTLTTAKETIIKSINCALPSYVLLSLDNAEPIQSVTISAKACND